MKCGADVAARGIGRGTEAAHVSKYPSEKEAGRERALPEEGDEAAEESAEQAVHRKGV